MPQPTLAKAQKLYPDQLDGAKCNIAVMYPYFSPLITFGLIVNKLGNCDQSSEPLSRVALSIFSRAALRHAIMSGSTLKVFRRILLAFGIVSTPFN